MHPGIFTKPDKASEKDAREHVVGEFRGDVRPGLGWVVVNASNF